MADSPNPNRRRRILIAFAAIGMIGTGAGAAVNVGVAHVLRLPDDAEKPEYTDAPVAQKDPAAAPDEGTDAPESPIAKSPAKPHALSQRAYADAIVRRNIFDSSAVYNPQAAQTGGAGECKADSSMKLLATVVAEPMQFSSALISGGGKDATAMGYSLGDDVNGEGRITLIDQKKVCLDGGSCLCMESSTSTQKTVASNDDSGSSDGGVTKTGDNSFQVDSSVIADAMNNFEALAGQLRVVPHKDSSGAVDGYRLSAIRRGSLFDKLGIKNGDIVHAVNGTPLTSTEGALATYQTLKNERTFSFDITRRNQRQTMQYEVR